MSRILVLVLALSPLGCASGGSTGTHEQHVAPAPRAAAPEGGESMGGGSGEASGPEHQPEVVRSGSSFRVSWTDAQARYAKGARCSGDDAPESIIGKPDQHNEMQVGRTKVVTYGFRFHEGTLMIRCRADHVETTRTMK
ncbi:MAG: hypothetical protein JWN44_3838 [Myxococcales bacterium]|nr:hypothetical protein [Myxococcales bacterium]